MIPGATRGVLFSYSSTDGIDGVSLITVSGALYLPAGEPPQGGWPLIAWSHGTVGIADICAPSTAGRSKRDLTYLSHWLRKGYAIVASDYQGLGTDGVHPYMATRPMAYSTLDGIRAVQQADFPVTDAVVVTGQSQGASAAIATAGWAADYAPDIDLRAISATGVPYFPWIIQFVMSRTDLDKPGSRVALLTYMMTLAEQIDPDFSLEEITDPEIWPVVSQAYDKCVYDFIDATVEAGLTTRQLINRKVRRVQKKAFAAMEYPTFKLNVPVFIGMGESDAITPIRMQRSFVRKACAAGSPVEAHEYSNANHDEGLLQSIPDVEAFIVKAFNGENLDGNCK